MGKNKQGRKDDATKSNSEFRKTKKQPQVDTRSAEEIAKAKEIAIALQKVELPTSAEGLTAEKLSSDQKMVFKKQCQNLYGHKFTQKKPAALSIESATSQLEAKMREKAKQLKEKKKKKQTEWNLINLPFYCLPNFRCVCFSLQFSVRRIVLS